MIIPQNYKSLLSIIDTEIAIKVVKDNFENELAKKLNLTRISAPLFVFPESGLNDNLSGIERPVAFDVLRMDGKVVEFVHSLAKWKRVALKRYGFKMHEGLYADMNAIRRDDDLDNLHSIYVDQWDWEVVISKQERNELTLNEHVTKIYDALLNTEKLIVSKYKVLKPFLPDKIKFVSSQELLDLYPTLSPKQRENKITEQYGAVCITKIGGILSNGEKHDNRAPDYDDWNFNADVLIWSHMLNTAVEITSMGVRVDEEALRSQIAIQGCNERLELEYHKMLLNGELPYTVGGGIGQSRLCLLLLQKLHIGEVHASVWPQSMVLECEEQGINLL